LENDIPELCWISIRIRGGSTGAQLIYVIVDGTNKTDKKRSRVGIFLSEPLEHTGFINNVFRFMVCDIINHQV